MRRRQLLAHLAVTAAATAVTPLTGQIRASASGAGSAGDLLVSRVRDAMLGLTPAPADLSEDGLHAGLAAALTDFHRCRYSRLADGLPRLISGGHTLAAAGDTPEASALLAGIYTLATRMLIKLDDQQLGWMAADRARVLAAGSGDPLTGAEAARNLAVLARKPAGTPRPHPSP